MGWGVEPDFSLQVRRRRWRCVLDPHLCMSPEGAALIYGLASHAELWLGPEFLNILDSWLLYDREPELLLPQASEPDVEGIRQALGIWQRLRDESGIGGGRLFWVRDAMRESCLPAGIDESVVPRWEAMAEALDERLSQAREESGPMIAALRDAAALAGLLPGAVLLTLRQSAAPALPPIICRRLEAWKLPCRQLVEQDDLMTLERNMMLRLLAEAGASGFLWTGLPLAVVHLVAPGHFRLPFGHGSADPGDESDFHGCGAPRPVKGVWDDARAFWYDLGPLIAV